MADAIQADYRATLLENHRLREENQRLNEALARHALAAPVPETSTQTQDKNQQLSFPEPVDVIEVATPVDKPAKVALFRAFRVVEPSGRSERCVRGADH